MLHVLVLLKNTNMYILGGSKIKNTFMCLSVHIWAPMMFQLNLFSVDLGFLDYSILKPSCRDYLGV